MENLSLTLLLVIIIGFISWQGFNKDQVMTVIVVSLLGFWALALGVPATVVLLLSAGLLFGIHTLWAKTI